nr:helix-turn-helix transcriptional regulator [Fodinicola feengrottensis]
MSWRAVSKPRPLFAPVISIVFMPPRLRPGRAASQSTRLPGTADTRQASDFRRTLVNMTATEFGQAVRRWRDRVTPAAAGLPTGGHRRAAGLRREELALLAGISVDYVTRLEQGRAANPSAQVVEALVRALRCWPEPNRARSPVRAGRPRRARTGHRPGARHAERPADAGPADRHPRRGLRRDLDAAGRQPAVRRTDGRPVRAARQRTQRRLAYVPRPSQPRPTDRASPAPTGSRPGRRPACRRWPLSG